MTRVLLIGASTPIGRAIAARFHTGGAEVVGASLQAADDPVLAADLVADCSTPAGAADAVRTTVELLDGIDILVCAAGQQPRGPLHRTSDHDWRRAFDGCLDTVFYTAREALPRMRRGAAIIAVSSVNATRPAPWMAAYVAAKGAVEALVRAMAVDYAASGIRVNAVAPGLVLPGPPASNAPGQRTQPVGRPVRPEEVANAVYFLASPEASAITGLTVPVDAGLTALSASTYARLDLYERVSEELVGEITSAEQPD